MPHRESGTHVKRIDPVLDALGWRRKQRRLRGPYRVDEYETTSGPADYALCHNSRVLGVIEAKRGSRWDHRTSSPRPSDTPEASPPTPSILGVSTFLILYSTNGEVIWFHDVRHPLNTSRRVACFHSPAGEGHHQRHARGERVLGAEHQTDDPVRRLISRLFAICCPMGGRMLVEPIRQPLVA